MGTGNPESKILIIGKECAVDSKEQVDTDTLKRREYELLHQNLNGWEAVIYPERFTAAQRTQAFPVLFPHPGQKNKPDRNRNGGTSDTWVKYQKICDAVYHQGVPSETINFHDRIFITEMNQIPSAWSAHQDKWMRKESVARRQVMFRECRFFQQFPVVILACGPYPREMGFDIEETFRVQWDRQIRGKARQFYNLHQASDHRIVIHTRQLSTDVSDGLIENLRREIVACL